MRISLNKSLFQSLISYISRKEIMKKIFISNITSNERYTPDLHRLVCDVRREGEHNIEKQKTWVLSHEEYKSVIATGSYRTK